MISLMQAIYAVTTLYDTMFGDPCLVAVGSDLTSQAKLQGASEADLHAVTLQLLSGKDVNRSWTDDGGDGVQVTYYWQSTHMQG